MVPGSKMETLLKLTLLTCCVATASPCLQCDYFVKDIHRQYFESCKTTETPDEMSVLRHSLDTAVQQLLDVSMTYGGIIAREDLVQARWNYINDFQNFLDQVKEEKDKRKEHMAFIDVIVSMAGRVQYQMATKNLCPNKCGTLTRLVMDCLKCVYVKHPCPSPTGSVNCDVMPLKKNTGESFQLECVQPWHAFNAEKYIYIYSFAQNDSRDFRRFRESHTPMILDMVTEKDQGTYRCSARNTARSILYQVEVNLTVIRVPPKPIVPRPTLPPLPPKKINSLQIFIYTMFGLCFVFLWFCIIMIITCIVAIELKGKRRRQMGTTAVRRS